MTKTIPFLIAVAFLAFLVGRFALSLFAPNGIMIFSANAEAIRFVLVALTIAIVFAGIVGLFLYWWHRR